MNKLTCSLAKNIPLEDILLKLGIALEKERGHELWYMSPFRTERTASFKINTKLNKFRDFGNGFSGDPINFIMLLNNCSTSKALEILSSMDSLAFSFPKQIVRRKSQANKWSEKFVYSKLKDPKLINYLKYNRGIPYKIAKRFCGEAQLNSKFNYISFNTDLGGYALRNAHNKFGKRAVHPNGVRTINPGKDTLKIFEGFIDFLSYMVLAKKNLSSVTYIILNSTSNLKSILDTINKYKEVHAYFDNDLEGNRAFFTLNIWHPKAIRVKYYFLKNNFKNKDLNDYLIDKLNKGKNDRNNNKFGNNL